jgi:hypothetical protein
MKKWKVIAGIVVVFLLGSLAGSVITRIVFRHRLEYLMRGGPEAVRNVVVKRLVKALNLDAAQQSQLIQIVEDARQELMDVRRQTNPQIRRILDRAQNRVDAILRPDQSEKFHKIITRLRRRSIE